MDPFVAFTVTIIAVVFSALFSGAEIAFVQSNKVRIEIDATKRSLASRLIQGFTRNSDMFISTLLVGNNIALVIYGIAISAIINPLLEGWFDGNEALVLISNTVVSTLIILMAGEFFPKTTFRINPNFTMRLLALPLYLIYLVLYPLSAFTSWVSRMLMKLAGIKEDTTSTGTLTMEQLDDYIQQSIDENKDDSAIENEVKIFRNALDFKDTQIDECMIPRNEIVAVNIACATRTDLVRLFVQTGLSKIVVYKENIDNVVGYIHVAELFNAGADWHQGIKPVVYTPETMLANKMMRRLLAEHRSMAIVIDEFGGTAGLVTLEDLVEEIFGEIEDEHDRHRVTMRPLGPGRYEVSGRAEIEQVNEQLDIHIEESDQYHTLAGYLLHNLEALPAEGDTFILDGLNFRILRMTTTRIDLIEVVLPEGD